MDASEETATIALLGNPNAGKTTLFNALTGSNQRIGNYSGVTVEMKSGEFRTPHGKKIRLLDLPGCYSLRANSPDEQVAVDALHGRIEGMSKPDLVVCVVDASHLERHLQLAMQAIETGLPVVIALNMIDVAERAGLRLDPVRLSEELGVPVVPLHASAGKGVVELKQALRFPFPAAPEASWLGGSTASEETRRERIFEICALAARRPDEHQLTTTDRLDRWLLHPVAGWVFLVAVLFGLMWAIFSFAQVPMGWIESLQSLVSSWVENVMPDGDMRSLLVDGVIGGVGGVLIFLPQILLLFFFIGLLESSGYMARAAFLMDGLMARAGLSGKAFLPLFSSYACAIPGVMATRTIDSAKERLVAIFVAPWMSCSARLPVYFLIVPMLLHESEGTWKQAFVLFSVYAAGTLAALVVARLLRGRLGPDTAKSHFMLELPPYRAPQWKYIFRHVLDRGGAFVTKAGTVILGLSILLWALSTYPKSDGDDGEALQHSAMGRIGAVIEPAVEPLGFDGRVGTAILTSFAAREVFNSTLAVLFSVSEDGSDVENRDHLRERIASATWPDGRPLFTPLTLVSLLVFYIYALQCLPTSVVVAREAGSWKWAAGQFVFMSVFAYLASLLVFQVGRLFGF
ncbi:MAG: ferrous iron transporter B [Akkermansiaceae bacterium]|nr:ferrous iron transporter B [Akkermansiaceae bacterium]MCP5545061.1 ferrous iron transporter B [Akkermansiaceae bacterium]MCP5546219.1 ferrous iron transporter B [Akkermansiaceae bacterium]